ncbi:uncharacterized protein PFL1_03941 [Pseudozyma flocculosa PF-1]|uniref:Zn(2)-C6 fungal-type domain-containing protein n=2 Tax=Pseudozyma flocculosa TaxID=84751 RepID=A0A5C3EWF5_9BASI|nr:uncharacterized protein PFL1_03941 [Pseudozyma flocculosa PF-1]EPQ28638.1 hypothetical protein PFL1_03941 [Pseudozyma flocculosa PF-1]SPO36584.1 uncharacterized protein PSFLO_02055 [Pseudozyma flocculosa]
MMLPAPAPLPSAHRPGLRDTEPELEPEPEPAPTKKKMFKNCDHCRAAKRACDAKYTSLTHALQTGVACSNCRRKGKTCTFNHLISTFGVADLDLSSIRAIEASGPPTSSSDTRPDKRRRGDDSGSDNSDGVDEVIGARDAAVLVRQGGVNVTVVPPDSSPLAFQAAGTRLATNLDRIYLDKDLVSIYEGAAEQALRCWIRDTPYLFLDQAHQNRNPFNDQTLHTRVCLLDRGARNLFRGPQHRLAASEKIIHEALHATMLAFAAQWPRHRKRIGDHTDNWLPDEERIRLELWRNARDRLMIAAEEAPSFRVVYALILFAWTEKPRDVPTHAHWQVESTAAVQTALYENSAVETSSWQDPAEASTMMLATAGRKLLQFRNRIMNLRRRGVDPWSATQPNRSAPLDAEQLHRRNIEIQLFNSTWQQTWWLGVMIDSEVAVLRKHPPVICDDDTDLVQYPLIAEVGGVGAPQQQQLPGPPGQRRQTRKIWDDLILSCSEQREADFARQWPNCTEEQALRILGFSAPVKVLLFRHIGRLQAAYWRTAEPDTIERHIQQALDVVFHWERVYQPFIESCISAHGALPPSIQSWYTLITAPWNLAVLLLVELAQTVDQACLSDPQARRLREQGETFSTLRRKACNQTAALIHAVQAHEQQRQQSTTSSTDAFSFVHTTGGTILHTEPWAEIMVNSFFSMAKSEIRLFNGLAANFQWQELECSQHRVEKYLWALDQLSNRSHLAELAYQEIKTMSDFCSPGRSVGGPPSQANLQPPVAAYAPVQGLVGQAQQQGFEAAMMAATTSGLSSSDIAALSPNTQMWQDCLAALGTPYPSDPPSSTDQSVDVAAPPTFRSSSGTFQSPDSYLSSSIGPHPSTASSAASASGQHPPPFLNDLAATTAAAATSTIASFAGLSSQGIEGYPDTFPLNPSAMHTPSSTVLPRHFYEFDYGPSPSHFSQPSTGASTDSDSIPSAPATNAAAASATTTGFA